MSHIHLPDGILPTWLWLSGYLITAALITGLWRFGQATAEPRKFALLGIFTAITVLVMMIEIPPLGYHFNLSIVTGIILGPRLSVLAALMANMILALIGHGGITVIGLNTLVLSVEMIFGYYVFRYLSALKVKASKSVFAATIIGLGMGTAFGFGIIVLGASGIDRLLQSASSGEDFGAGIEGPHLNLTRLAVIMFGLGGVGWVLEGLLSSAVLVYLDRVYPGLIGRD